MPNVQKINWLCLIYIEFLTTAQFSQYLTTNMCDNASLCENTHMANAMVNSIRGSIKQDLKVSAGKVERGTIYRGIYTI